MKIYDLSLGMAVEVLMGGRWKTGFVEYLHPPRDVRTWWNVQVNVNGVTWLGAPEKVQECFHDDSALADVPLVSGTSRATTVDPSSLADYMWKALEEFGKRKVMTTITLNPLDVARFPHVNYPGRPYMELRSLMGIPAFQSVEIPEGSAWVEWSDGTFSMLTLQ